ncbi:hypothetical protein LAZ67_19002484 [Cordylochernes scorpioides]|uniref:FLYWCH-type domain-containing protein n=1 Tax=Cordylochernes scorpioides TaxID=51811 RepID=A0ABY6LK81_9ARAC|nr:hypothetical protein LAZ67_19002484 [Cordylochernes scorpioides]
MKKISQLKENIHRSHLKISLAIVLVLKTDDGLSLGLYKFYKAAVNVPKKERNLKAYRCRQLKHRTTGRRWKRILFTDEKMFTLEQAHNHQNDRSWSAKAPGTSAIVEHRQNRQGQNHPRSVSPRHSRGCRSPVGSTALRRCGLDILGELCAGSQGEIDFGLVQGPFSGLHHVGRMAALLTRSQPDGLQRVVHLQARACATRHKSLKSLK